MNPIKKILGDIYTKNRQDLMLLGIDEATWVKWKDWHVKYGIDKAIEMIDKEMIKRKFNANQKNYIIGLLAREMGDYFPTGFR